MYVRPVAIGLVALLAGLSSASAQTPALELPSFKHLREQAVEFVDIEIGSWPLWIAARFMGGDDPESAQVREVLGGLEAVLVRSYEFDKDFAYSSRDLEAVRSQLSLPGWHQVVHVLNRTEQSAVDVYLSTADGKARGLAIVASEPRKLTIVHIVGSVDVERLAKIQGRAGVPRIDLEQASVRADL